MFALANTGAAYLSNNFSRTDCPIVLRAPTGEIFVNSYHWFEILPCLQAKELVCHILMGAGRRHSTPRSETKVFIIQNTAGSMSFIFASVPVVSQVSQVWCGAFPHRVCTQRVSVTTEEP